MIVLTATLHDPDAGLQWIFEETKDTLLSLFDSIVVVSSPFTDDAFLSEMTSAQCVVHKREDNLIGRTYFRAVEEGYTSGADIVFYCDFDRILHWAKNYTDELARFVAYLKSGDSSEYIVCQRTPQAYALHHEALFETEKEPNKIISNAMGETKTKDFLAGCFVYKKNAAKIVVEQGGYDGMELFGGWPVLLKHAGISIEYTSFDGLSWETPNQHRKAVEVAGGVDAWRVQLSTEQEWEKRRTMAKAFVADIV